MLNLGRDFRLYATGRAVSIVGDRIALITLVFLVVHRSHSYAPALALFYICRVAPTLIGGVFVGVIADHFDRRRLMIGCDVGRTILMAAIPALTGLTLAAIYPLVLGLYALTMVFSAAAGAALPDVIPEPGLMRANAILNGIGNTADVAYAAGGVLIYALGFRLPFYIDAATFAFSAVMIIAMRIPKRERQGELNIREVIHRIRAGAAFIRGNPFLRWSVLAFAVAPTAGGAAYVIAPIYAGHVLSHSADLIGPLRSGAFRFSVLEVFLGLGGLAGSSLAPFLARKAPRGALFGLGLLGTGAADVLLATTSNIYFACLLMAFSGLWFSVFIVSGMTLSQTLTPTEMRGRVVAARATVINGALLLGSTLGGLALLVLSVRALWVIEGLVIMASSLFIWLVPAVRNQS